jgi:D-alanine-D-alanine ligase-like ATP-grasp enzyme
MNPLSQRLLETLFGRVLFGLTEYVIVGTMYTFRTLGIVRFDSDISRITSERGHVLATEAVSRGWGVKVMQVFGRQADAYEMTSPSGEKIFFSSLPRLERNADIVAGWIDDKALLKERLSANHVHVSRGKSFSRWEDAEAYFHTVEKPIIVKPRLGSRGRHTTTKVMEVSDFKRAFEIAKQLGRHVVVEEHLIGSVYRATIIDGELAGVLAGDPPRITGDGIHTIRELIEMKNKNRHARVGEVLLTEQLRTFLKRQRYTLESVLREGEIIDLSEKIGLSYGGKSREVTPEVHPKLRAELEHAGHIVNDPLLGFDFITTDVSVDPDTIKWGIIECNTVPFINLHHDPLEGVPVNVAGKVMDYLERKMNV